MEGPFMVDRVSWRESGCSLPSPSSVGVDGWGGRPLPRATRDSSGVLASEDRASVLARVPSRSREDRSPEGPILAATVSTIGRGGVDILWKLATKVPAGWCGYAAVGPDAHLMMAGEGGGRASREYYRAERPDSYPYGKKTVCEATARLWARRAQASDFYACCARTE
ncbi:hypothetical protein EV182_003701 [Spiromyces aspiralis]|uniref:Uncharacterized protein n=1 Tax=Spiromyces aspiralis TaxID=68401 RepID=A0ACC1HTE3_9FUNG|nr:hypothetical protein EV182_003701 [Spiromyces aspiralis]